MFTSILFRVCAYSAFGLIMELLFSVAGIEVLMGCKIPNKRMSKRFLEGFVSLWMIPLYCYIGFAIMEYIPRPTHMPVVLRYCVWAWLLAGCEAFYGWMLDDIFHDYPWSYYSLSKYTMFKRGYTLWTLLPMWGFVGLLAEKYVALVLYLSPYVEKFVWSN